jgi:hypothetical protein
MKYSWLNAGDYTSMKNLKVALKRIFDQFGEPYTIHFPPLTALLYEWFLKRK